MPALPMFAKMDTAPPIAERAKPQFNNTD